MRSPLDGESPKTFAREFRDAQSHGWIAAWLWPDRAAYRDRIGRSLLHHSTLKHRVRIMAASWISACSWMKCSYWVF